MSERFYEINGIIRDIAKNFKLMPVSCKLVLLPDPGLDMIRYNKIAHPVPWRLLVEQSELEERLHLLHLCIKAILYIKAINSFLGTITPWSLDVSFSHRNGHMIPVYDRTYDRLHFSKDQVQKLASVVAVFARNELEKP